MIKTLQNAGHFTGWVSNDASLALFHKHFAVMHTLYRLRREYASSGRELKISALNIQLSAPSALESAAKQLTDSLYGVEQFYLDWSHFVEATPDSVVELLQNFWRRYAAVDETAAALQTLGLESGASWPAIQKQYRRLAAEHHPDKGGEREVFTRIRVAYETLRDRNGL